MSPLGRESLGDFSAVERRMLLYNIPHVLETKSEKSALHLDLCPCNLLLGCGGFSYFLVPPTKQDATYIQYGKYGQYLQPRRYEQYGF